LCDYKYFANLKIMGEGARSKQQLTEVAMKMAEAFKPRAGSYKNLLSAGVVLYWKATPEQREEAMATGVKYSRRVYARVCGCFWGNNGLTTAE